MTRKVDEVVIPPGNSGFFAPSLGGSRKPKSTPLWDGSLWVPRSADVYTHRDTNGLSVEGWQEVEPGVWEVTFDGTAANTQYGVSVTFNARDIFGQPAKWYARPYSRMRVLVEPDPGSDVRVVAGPVQSLAMVVVGYGVSWNDPAGWCPYAFALTFGGYNDDTASARHDPGVIVDGEFRHNRMEPNFLITDSVRCSPVVDDVIYGAENHAITPGPADFFNPPRVGLSVFCPSGTPGPQTVRVRVGWEIIPDPPTGEEE